MYYFKSERRLTDSLNQCSAICNGNIYLLKILSILALSIALIKNERPSLILYQEYKHKVDAISAHQIDVDNEVVLKVRLASFLALFLEVLDMAS